VVDSVQISVRRYLLIAGGLLLRAAASIRIWRKNSWHHAVTGIHPGEPSLPSQKAAWSATLTVQPKDGARPARINEGKGNAGSAPNKKPLVLVGEKRRSKRRLSASGWASFQSTA
jgi:hypothetical protein